MQTSRKPTPHAEALLIAGLVVIAILARWAGWREKTGDMSIFFQWHRQLREAGGWRGLGTEVGNYNAPFLYLLAATIYLPGPLILKIKAVFVVFDVLLAFFTYRLAGLHRPGSRVPVAAALIVVLLPTVVINASLWGQMDAMWAAPALGGVYYLLRGKPWVGVALFGVALAFKPQGVFIFPLLLLLVLAGKIPWRTLLAAPAVFLLLDVPAILLGRNPIELLTIYSMNRQAVHVPALSLRAPNVFAFLPSGPRDDTVRTLGYLLTAALVLGVIYVLIARSVELTRERVVTAAALFSIMVPFLMPGMHERYFYLADVMTVILAVYVPRLWFVPLLVQASSLLAYQPYLSRTGSTVLPMPIPATLMLTALLTVAYPLLRDAFQNAKNQNPQPASATPPESPTASAPAPNVPPAPAPNVPLAPAPNVPSAPAPNVPLAAAPNVPSEPAPNVPLAPAPNVVEPQPNPDIPQAPPHLVEPQPKSDFDLKGRNPGGAERRPASSAALPTKPSPVSPVATKPNPVSSIARKAQPVRFCPLCRRAGSQGWSWQGWSWAGLELGWAGLSWIGLSWIGLSWAGLSWAELRGQLNPTSTTPKTLPARPA